MDIASVNLQGTSTGKMMNFLKKWLAGEAVSGGSRGPARNRCEGVSAWRRHLMPLWFVGCLATVAALLGASPSFGQTALPGVACPTSLGSCTANDLQTTVQSASILGGDSCSGPDDTVNVQLNLALNLAGGGSRYDVGVYVATNGGSVNNGQACVGSPAPTSSPFVDLDNRNVPPDAPNTCGDINANVLWPVTATVKCNVANGQLAIPSCRVWDQNKKKKTDACTTVAQAGTGSKCDCGSLLVPVTSIAFGTLTVNKVLVPAGDPGKFNLTIDGQIPNASATNVGNTGTTGAITVNTGSHTVGETAGTNTTLTEYDTTYSCSVNGGTPTVGPTAAVVANQNTTCTITNTRKTTPVCRMLKTMTSGSAVTPPGSVLFGSGMLTGTCTGTNCSLTIDTTTGMFNGKGLIYNDGQFPVSPACNGPAEACFPTQSTTLPSASPFPTTSPGFDLAGLALSGVSGTITFGAGGTYSYAGSKFGAPHSGTYQTIACDSVVPEPGSLPLVLLSLAGLGLAGWVQAKRRSRPTAARSH